ncbi:MAG: hypothetical protein ACQEXQ_12565 [Bacillota bacterium]
MGFCLGGLVAEGSSVFPNFYPVGVYTSRELAMKEIEVMPKDKIISYYVCH